MRWANTFIFACALAYLPEAIASDISRGVRSASESPLMENGGYFELGLIGIVSNQVMEHINPEDNQDNRFGWSVTFSGEYRYKKLFVEASEGTIDGANLGYTLWNNDTWQVDFIANLEGRYNSDNEDIEETDTEDERNQKIIDRNTLYGGMGLRVTGYLGDNIVQYRLVSDTLDGNGFESSLRMGRHWQYRNWNFHGIVGGNYLSARTSDYFWGITEDEATERFPAYKASDSVIWQLEFGVTYPISENWVFRTTARHFEFPGEKTDSPLVKDDHSSSLSTTITYVF